ncbi:hypothetical protein [Vampirovibrio chlorellavorus]|uniref:hypothetical protein n=1 Tax=Vampirovibrio chlorellavorus TaxID=758823 RepID=UPI0026E944EB|nr:hypothetical protein [Vampirovibrio chlorellavorus]
MRQPFHFDPQKIEHVSGIFSSTIQLNEALDSLERLGLGKDVSLLMSEETRSYYGEEPRHPVHGVEGFTHSSKLPEGAATGGLTGGLLGAILGGLTTVGTILIPGAGLLVAGPLIGLLSGGALGAAAGSLLGALVGAGIPETEAKFYEDSLKQPGNALLIAHVPKNMVPDVKDIYRHCGVQSLKVG